VIHPPYPAARVIAPRVHDYFARQLATTEGPRGPLPAVAEIEVLIDAAFWASLRREEGFVPQISLALLPATHAGQPLRFRRPLALLPSSLSRLAPAVERPGIHLGVWESAGSLAVWGTSWHVPPGCIVIEVVAPGLLVVKHRRREESSKFANVAVLEGDRVKVLDERVPRDPDCPRVITSLFGYASPADWVDSTDVLVPFAASMRAHKRGGMLLVVPDGGDAWRESIVQPILYAVEPFDELAHAGADAAAAGPSREAFSRTVDALAGLTAVDGATIITDRHALLAFGAKITRRRSHPTVERVLLTEPVEGASAEIVEPGQLGGTRHLSAAQFVQDQPDSVALVASQDGRFTVFTWAAPKRIVHAHRVEALLL
jgi:hypothetical protein